MTNRRNASITDTAAIPLPPRAVLLRLTLDQGTLEGMAHVTGQDPTGFSPGRVQVDWISDVEGTRYVYRTEYPGFGPVEIVPDDLAKRVALEVSATLLEAFGAFLVGILNAAAPELSPPWRAELRRLIGLWLPELPANSMAAESLRGLLLKLEPTPGEGGHSGH